PDLVVANGSSGLVNVLLGTGAGSFQPKVDYPTAFGASSVVIADVNGDGKPDLVMTHSGSNGLVSVLLGNATGTDTFQQHQDYAAGNSPVSLAVADINGDSTPDILVADLFGSTVAVLP